MGQVRCSTRLWNLNAATPLKRVRETHLLPRAEEATSLTELASKRKEKAGCEDITRNTK